MLQINVTEFPGRVPKTLTVTLQGIIDDYDARKFEQWWNHLRSRSDRATWIVDLSHAEIASEPGRRMIRKLSRDGVRFKGVGPSLDLIIESVCLEQRRTTRLGRRFTSMIVFE